MKRKTAGVGQIERLDVRLMRKTTGPDESHNEQLNWDDASDRLKKEADARKNL